MFRLKGLWDGMFALAASLRGRMFKKDGKREHTEQKRKSGKFEKFDLFVKYWVVSSPDLICLAFLLIFW